MGAFKGSRSDSAFEAISNEIDEYRKSLERKTLSQITDIEVNTLSLDKFVDAFQRDMGLK
jgi:hypothetical protein